MRNGLLMSAALVVAALMIGSVDIGVAYAKDVHVQGHTRRDGTYVAPHVRSSPDGSKANNYGPSQSAYERMNGRARDNDGDGTPNYLDRDDDNDGIGDNYDGNQYGR